MMIAELADGKKLSFPDDTPDETVDAIVMLHVQVGQLTQVVRELQESNRRIEAAFLATREIVVKRNIKDEVIGATSTVITKH